MSTIGKWSPYAFLCAALLVLSSCGSFSDTFTTQEQEPTELEKLSTADLSARGPRTINPRQQDLAGAQLGAGRFEKYPGDERVRIKRIPIRGAKDVGNGYELNFSNAPLAELAQVILRDTLQIPYTFDSRVQGRVTLSTGKAVSRDELLSVLASVLQMNNGALIRDNGQYRIIPLAAAQRGGVGEVNYAAERKRAGPGYGVTVFPLKHISSAAMLRMLNAFIAKSGTLRAEASQNLLLMRGTDRERNSLMEIASSFDVDWLRGQSAAIYPIAHATPDEMITELKRVFQTEQGGLGAGLVKFQPIERLNAVLVLARRASMLNKVATWVRRLDRTNATGLNLYVYSVENGKAKDLAAVLTETFSNNAPERRSAAAEVSPDRRVSAIRSDRQEGAANNQVENPANESVSPQPPRTQTSKSSSKSSPASNVRITADEINNKLLIRATGRDYQKVLRILRRIDQPPLQVHINATIAEVTLNDNLRYGVQVFLRNKQNSNPTKALGFTNDNSLVIQPSFPGLNLLYGGTRDSPKVILDALSGVTNVKVVSSPSLVVLNNQAATLQVGDEVPVTTRSAISVTDPLAPVVNTVQFRDTGVILKVTPRVNSSGLVTMEIQQEISRVVSSTPTGTQGSLTPTISQRKISSVIAVYSGQMVVLGGLISEREDNTKNGVPIIEHIPIIGDLIGNTNNANTRTELVIFLRPKVIRDGSDASLIAREVRSRLQLLSPTQQRGYAPYKKSRSGKTWK